MRPIGPGSPMRKLGAPRSILAGGASDRSGRWPSRVWMTSMPVCARRLQHAAQRLDRARKLRDVVAERFAEAAGLQKVALHVDDQQRGRRPVDLDRPGSAARVPMDSPFEFVMMQAPDRE